MRHPRLLAGLLIAGVVVVLVVAGLGAGGPDLHPSDGPSIARADATPAAACVPPAGSGRLPALAGRLPVVLHVPPHARSGAPLVIGLPGAGQTARDFAAYTGYSRLADRRGFFVAYPTATGVRPSWNISGTAAGKPDDVAYLRAVIAQVLKASCASPRRVGVTGVSNGGGMSARLACDAADLISAAAPVAGGYGSLPGCTPSQPVAILEVHGTSDEVVPYDGKGPDGFGKVSRFLNQWRRLDSCPAAVRRASPLPGVAELTWAPCRSGTAVEHERIADEPHGWPGGADVSGRTDFSSTVQTWAFLSAHGR